MLTQFSGGEGRHTLKDYIDIPGVYPVGRLDRDSEGLLLLTDDGALAHRLTDPRFAHPRTYWVQVEGTPDGEALGRLAAGVEIQGIRTRPATAVAIAEPDLPERPVPIRVRKSIPASWIALTLTEGRNRQVRRMTAAVGYATLRLVRVAIGALTLGDLAPGRWRYLGERELRLITSKPGRSHIGRF